MGFLTSLSPSLDVQKRKKNPRQIATMNCLRCHSPATSDTSGSDVNESSLTLTSDEGQIEYICHSNCTLQCRDCGQSLEQGRCFVTGTCDIYCHTCYRNRHTICHICDRIMENGDFVVKMGQDVNVHTNCITCATCSKPYTSKMNFNSESKQFFCEEHSNLHDALELPSEIKTEKNNDDTIATTASESNETETDNVEMEDDSDDKKKRTPRTKFTEKQTALMMNIFAQTPRPTRLMREHMAKETGLPIRCIQIWFQNKRSKEKRQSSKRTFMQHHQANWYHPYQQQQQQQTTMPVYRAPPSVSPPNQVYWSPSPPSSECGSDYIYQPPAPAFDTNVLTAFEGQAPPQVTATIAGPAQPCYPSPPWNGVEN